MKDKKLIKLAFEIINEMNYQIEGVNDKFIRIGNDECKDFLLGSNEIYYDFEPDCMEFKYLFGLAKIYDFEIMKVENIWEIFRDV